MDTLKKEVIIQTLQDNKKLLQEKFGITKIALFGSYAKNKADNESDIDILIETNIITFRNRINLKHFLEKKFNKKVEIGYFKSMRPSMFRKIEEEIIYA